MKNYTIFLTVALMTSASCKKNDQVSTLRQEKPSQISGPQRGAGPFLSTTGIGGYNLDNPFDQVLAYGNYGNHLICYRPGSRAFWELYHSTSPFASSFVPEVRSSGGVAGYDLANHFDRIITFDYDHNGEMKYLVAYRPSKGAIYIIKNNWSLQHPVTSFSAAFKGGNGIAGYDLSAQSDKVAAFDYEHSGKLDYLVLTRDGKGLVWILKNNNGTFTPIYQSNTGIGDDDFKTRYNNFNFQDENDRDMVFAFDYNHSGLKDYLGYFHRYIDFTTHHLTDKS